MGSALGTTGLSVVAALSFVVAAILSIIGADRLKKINGYNSNSDLKGANSNLTWGSVAGWIAAVAALILMLGYLLVHVEILQNETVHLIGWMAAFAAAIIAIVFIGLALRKIDETVGSDQEVQGYLIWAMILTGLGLGILVMMGLWRIMHHVTICPRMDENKHGLVVDQKTVPYGPVGQPGRNDIPNRAAEKPETM